MATFINPNSPPQPQIGVYGWFVNQEGGRRLAIYIGMAGKKQSITPRGTLFRGVSELQRNTFTSNSPKYNTLDTDFIVGTAIRYFEECGYTCDWEHLCNQPEEELDWVRKEKPLLQEDMNTHILEQFRCRREGRERYWRDRQNPQGIKEAEELVFAELEKICQQDGRAFAETKCTLESSVVNRKAHR